MAFDPDKYLAKTKPAAAFDPDAYLAKQEAPEEEAKGSPLAATRITSDKKVSEIAAKHGIDPEWLKSQRALLGGVSESTELGDIAAETGGAFLSAITGDIPGFIAKKLQNDPKKRAAMDDLMEEVRTNRSWLQGLSGMLVGGGLAAGAAKKAGATALAKEGIRRAPVTYEVAKRAVPAVAGAGAGLAGSKEGEELQTAATGAVFGYGLGTLLPSAVSKLSKARLESKADDIAKIAERTAEKRAARTEVEKGLLDQVYTKDFDTFLKKTSDEAKQALLLKSDAKKVAGRTKAGRFARQTLEEAGLPVNEENLLNVQAYTRAKQIASRLGAKPGEGLEELARVTDTDKLKGLYDDAILRESAISAVSKNKNLTVPWYRAAQQTVQLTSDGKPLAQMLDKKLGLSGDLSIELAIDDISAATNKMRVDTFGAAEDVNRLAKQRGDISPAQITEGLASGREDGIYGEYRQVFNDLVDTAGKYGIKIDYRKDYVPEMRKRAMAYRASALNEIDRLGKEYGTDLYKLNQDDYNKLIKQPDFKDLVEELSPLQPIKNAGDLVGTLNNLRVNRKATTQLLENMEAAVAKRRTGGDIPAWAKETNIDNLINQWVNKTLKIGATDKYLRRLDSAADVADKAGDIDAASHIRELSSQLRGSQEGFGGALGEVTDKVKTALKRKIEGKRGLEKTAATGAAYAFQTLSSLPNMVYGNLISRPYHMAQNLSSPATTIAPELGARGPAVYLSSMYDIAKFGKEEGFGKLDKLLKDKGLYPPQWKGEYANAVKENIIDDNLTRITGKAADKLTGAALYGFERTEFLARASSYFMAKRTAKLLEKNDKFAGEFLDQITSPAYKRKLTELQQAGKTEELADSLAKYFNSEHLFNYDKANMARYARNMGPMFSIFSKWPTAMAGKAVANVANKGLLEGTDRYIKTIVAPWAALEVMDKILELDTEDQTPREKALMGRKGLSGMSGGDTLFGVISSLGSGDITGEALKTPAFQTLGTFSEAFKSDDPEGKMLKALDRAAMTFVPGPGAIKLYLQDLPSIYTNEEAPDTDYKTEGLLKSAKDTLSIPAAAIESVRNKLKEN